METSLQQNPVKMSGKKRHGILSILFPTLISIVLTAVVLMVAKKIPDTSLFHRLIFGQGMWHQAIVPAAILVLFFWSMTDIFIKYLCTLKQSHALKNKQFGQIPSFLALGKVKEAVADLDQKFKGSKKSLAFERARSLLYHLDSKNDPVRSHEFIRHQLEIDAEISTASYTTVRIFIWAMPILGFIGTVLGIGLAVGGFSAFLGGEIENIDLVKNQLAEVAGGLSFAFDTTLLGLVTSLVAMICATFVQNRDESIVTGLDELCLGVISAFKTSKSEQETGLPPIPVPAMPEEAISQAISDLKELIDLNNRTVIEFVTTARALSENFASQNSHEKAIADSLAGVREGMETASANFTRNLANLESSHQNIAQVVETVPAKLGAAINEQIKLVGGQMQSAMAQPVKAANDLNATLSQTGAAVSSAMEPIAKAKDQHIEIAQTLDSFKGVMSDLVDTQTRLEPTIKKLSQPFELKMVPADE